MRSVFALLSLLTVSSTAMRAADSLGQPLTLREPTPLATIEASPAQYVGKTVQVKGKVTEVCQMAGCWMALAEPGSGRTLQVRVKDGDIVFPKEAVGRMALAEGKLVKLELTREQVLAQARHEAAEQQRAFHPEKVKAGATIYQLQGTGAVLLD